MIGATDPRAARRPRSRSRRRRPVRQRIRPVRPLPRLRRFRRLRSGRWLRLLRSGAAAPALLACLLAAAEGSAQQPERPVWPYRHMAVGNVAFLDSWRPAVQAGYLFQPGLGKTRVTQGEFGEAVVTPVRWYLHTLASAGWTWDKDGSGSNGFSALAQLGVVHRLRRDAPLTVSRVGLAAQAATAPRGIGPVLRLELFHGNAAVSAGWMRFRGSRRDGFVFTADLLRCILQDLGLVSRCDIL